MGRRPKGEPPQVNGEYFFSARGVAEETKITLDALWGLLNGTTTKGELLNAAIPALVRLLAEQPDLSEYRRKFLRLWAAEQSPYLDTIIIKAKACVARR